MVMTKVTMVRMKMLMVTIKVTARAERCRHLHPLQAPEAKVREKTDCSLDFLYLALPIALALGLVFLSCLPPRKHLWRKICRRAFQ